MERYLPACSCSPIFRHGVLEEGAAVQFGICVSALICAIGSAPCCAALNSPLTASLVRPAPSFSPSCFVTVTSSQLRNRRRSRSRALSRAASGDVSHGRGLHGALGSP